MRRPSHCGCCILPPALLLRIARNGNAQQRDAALDTLAVDHTLRLGRATWQLLDGGTRRGLFGLAGACKQRSIYDAHGAEALPGRLVRAEGAAAQADVEVNEAYDGLGATFDFYADVYDRNS